MAGASCFAGDLLSRPSSQERSRAAVLDIVSAGEVRMDPMTATMRAARWHGRGDVRVQEVPVPEPGPGDVVLKVAWCGICGTDVEEYRDGPVVIPVDRPNPLTGQRAPVTLGHEFAGTVAAVGRA